RHRILLLRAQLGGRPRRARRQEHRVVTEPAIPARLPQYAGGAEPAPPTPRARNMLPGQPPPSTASPPPYTNAHADTNAAPRRSAGTSLICASSSAVLPESSPWGPDHRADSTPGIPFSASTSNPESSATVATPEARYASRALANAFSSNVAPVSGASSNAATSSNDNSVNDT